MRVIRNALVCLLVTAEAVLLQDEEDAASILHHRGKYLPEGFTDAVHACLASSQEGGWPSMAGVAAILPCMGRGALAALSAANAEERVQLAEGVTLSGGGGGGGAARTLLDDAVAGAGGAQALLDASALVLGRRALTWDLAELLPGMALRYSPPPPAAAYVGDPVNAAGVIEFVMVRRSHLHDFDVRSIGLGQLMLRQTLLPFLLGLKLPVAALVPVLLAGLALLAKKALLLAKVALLVAGLSAAGSLLRAQQQYQPQQVLHDSPHSLYHSFFRGVNYGAANGERGDDVDNVRDGRSVSGGARNFAWE